MFTFLCYELNDFAYALFSKVSQHGYYPITIQNIVQKTDIYFNNFQKFIIIKLLMTNLWWQWSTGASEAQGDHSEGVHLKQRQYRPQVGDFFYTAVVLSFIL